MTTQRVEKKIVFVYAGNYQQFRDFSLSWRRDHPERQDVGMLYIYDANSLRGTWEPLYARIGNWSDHSDNRRKSYPTIRQMLADRHAIEISESEI